MRGAKKGGRWGWVRDGRGGKRNLIYRNTQQPSLSYIAGLCSLVLTFLYQKFEHLSSVQVICDPLAQPPGVILREPPIQHHLQPTWSRKWNMGIRKWSRKWNMGIRKWSRKWSKRNSEK